MSKDKSFLTSSEKRALNVYLLLQNTTSLIQSLKGDAE